LLLFEPEPLELLELELLLPFESEWLEFLPLMVLPKAWALSDLEPSSSSLRPPIFATAGAIEKGLSTSTNSVLTSISRRRNDPSVLLNFAHAPSNGITAKPIRIAIVKKRLVKVIELNFAMMMLIF
jgi:hypothetical protein